MPTLPRSRHRARTAPANALFLVAILGAAGCGDDAPEAPKPPSLREVARRAEEISNHIVHVNQVPWKTSVGYFDATLIPFQTRLLSAATRAANADEGSRGEALAEARRLLERYDREFAKPVSALDALRAIGDRIHARDVALRTLLTALAVPVAEPFPVRQAYEDGWTRAVREGFRTISEGLPELAQDATAARLRFGVASLTRAADDGDALFERLSLLAREVQSLAAAPKRLGALAAHARTVFERAGKAEGLSEELVPHRDALARTLAGIDADLAAHAVAEKSARALLIAGDGSATASVEAARALEDRVRSALLEPSLALGRALGIRDPD